MKCCLSAKNKFVSYSGADTMPSFRLLVWFFKIERPNPVKIRLESAETGQTDGSKQTLCHYSSMFIVNLL